MGNPRQWILIILIMAGVGIVVNLGIADGVSKKVMVPANWPPKVGAVYPDLELLDQHGNQWNLSRLKGQIIIVEPIGMNCPACQAWSGAHSKGGFGDIAPQKNLETFENYFNSFAKGLRLSDGGITVVQLILYDLKMGKPTARDAREWADHFEFKSENNRYVTVPTNDMRSQNSYALIPGFQLIDKNFILRSDSTGHNPKNNLYSELLPLVPQVLLEKEG
jgi:hypothetical protein